HHSDGAIDERFANKNQRRHVRDFLSHQPEIADRLAERFALLGVRNGAFDRNPRSTHAHRAKFETSHVQNVEGDDVPLADLAQQILHRDLAVIQNNGTGGRSANAHLVLFGADGKPRKCLFHEEGGKFLAINLRENSKKIGETGIRDPHLLAVQNVVLPVWRKYGTGAAIERIRARGRFRQSVCPNHLPGSQFRQIFFLLIFGAKINQRQQADTAMRAPGRRESGVFRDVVGDDGRRYFIHFQAAVRFRNLNSAEAKLARLLQQIARYGKILAFDLFRLRQNLVDRKFFRGLPDHLVLFGKIFRSENIGSLPLFQQKAAAENLGFWDCSGRHIKPLLVGIRQIGRVG